MEETKQDTEMHPPRNFDLTSFARAREKMVATNERAYQDYWNSLCNRPERIRDYSTQEIESIINSGSLHEQQKLSRNYFNKDGYYKRIIVYYATLLKYMGLLIPNPSNGKKLSTSHIQKRYYSALDFVERMHLPTMLTNIAWRALMDGAYYGIKVETDKNAFQLIDLPSGYACSRFKDLNGNDIVEFDLSYFGTILNNDQRDAALAAYPKFVAKAWKKFKTGKITNKWLVIPSDFGVCFPFFDGRPVFLNIIPSTIEYDEAVAIQKARDEDEIRKIVVQKIPHLSDGRLLFEPEEAEEIHQGTVGMMRGNKNVSVLTSYGDVDVVTSSAHGDNSDELLNRIEKNIYSRAGVSGQIFSATGGASLEASLNNDLALMMYFANKVSNYITNIINSYYANGNINFKYSIMPISHYNVASYVDSTFKLVGSGYSALLPALALGLTQKDLISVKDLENDVLKLGDKLIPLSTSYTQSSSDSNKEEENSEPETGVEVDEGGRPELKEEGKSDKTIQNEESLSKTEGGS